MIERSAPNEHVDIDDLNEINIDNQINNQRIQSRNEYYDLVRT